jgi:hypothetical protein
MKPRVWPGFALDRCISDFVQAPRLSLPSSKEDAAVGSSSRTVLVWRLLL